MFLKKGQLPILIVNILLILIFLPLSFKQENYEFVIYIGVIILFFVLILATNKRHTLSNFVLWGLTGWATLHMLGGFNGFEFSQHSEYLFFKIRRDGSHLRIWRRHTHWL